jgi:hypothetical protein
MAVYQISKIQIRRGKKNEGTGVPQLASGEMAWAVDTQELFIGNGAVSEGSPQVGNTKVLTEKDNIFEIVGRYQFAALNSSIQTNESAAVPIIQSLQEVLDRTVWAEGFGVRAELEDVTSSIQRAIDQLFLNPATKLETGTPGDPESRAFDAMSRVTLRFMPGVYKISSTIYLPSYVTIDGAGLDKTIFVATADFDGDTVFEFINDSSIDGTRNTLQNCTFSNQPRFVSLKNFSIYTKSNTLTGMKLNCVRDSEFENLEIVGNWTYQDLDDNPTCVGIEAVALNSLVSTQRNRFNNVKFRKLHAGIDSKYDIFNNLFINCEFRESLYGTTFGIGTSGMQGQEFGPRKNLITNSLFDSVYRNGILVEKGYGNRSRYNTFIDVGNDNGGFSNGLYPHVKFLVPGNSSLNDTSDRREGGVWEDEEGEVIANTNLSIDSSLAYDYVPEVQGPSYYERPEVQVIDISTKTYPDNEVFPDPNRNAFRRFAFRLPVNDATGFKVNYIINSNTYTQTKYGVLSIIVDSVRNTVVVSDDYNYTGSPNFEDWIVLSAGISGDSVIVYYSNLNASTYSGDTTLTFTYSVINDNREL